MTVDTFSRDQFEAALPRHKDTGDKLWEYVGLKDGEHCYWMQVDPVVAIFIRSSIRSNGVSAKAGEDSIRAWLVVMEGLKPLGSKVSQYTTRVPGWQARLTEVLRTLYSWRKKAGNCPACGRPKGIFKSKQPQSKGRVFAKCSEHNHFAWLD
jgi:hypothetical protein